MATTTKTKTSEGNGNGSATDALIKAAVQNAGVNMMMCDRDLVVTYANSATVQLVTDNLELFEETFPGFDAEGIVGSCIDMYHKDPAFQRKILGKAKNLPHRADIKIGPKIFALNIAATHDETGKYVGNCLEWQEVTEERKQSEDAARLMSSVEGSGTASMSIDLDLVPQYANPATTKLVTENLGAFQAAFPSVDFNNLMGVCVDVFHKDPTYQRGILGDAKNLPHVADITVGNLTFALNISAMFDAEGNHIGANLEWQNATEERQRAEDAARLRSAIEGSATPSMTIDRELVLQYANPSTVKLIGDNIDVFKAAFPNTDFDNLMGVCIDVFHKNPAYQRGILADAKNLPHTADITVGALTFALNISAMFDVDGDYIGCNLEWQNVTAAREQADNAARLTSSVEGSATASMSIDTDLVL
jgi:methyl-accepting chemotaxis protein